MTSRSFSRFRFGRHAILFAITAGISASCAVGGPGPVEPTEQGAALGGRGYYDAPDGSVRDPDGPSPCAAGYHLCGSTCEPDRTNEPQYGCRLGCGSRTCRPPEFGDAYCSSRGTCEVHCTPPALPDGHGGCACQRLRCEDFGAVCGEWNDGCGGRMSCGRCAAGTCVNGQCDCSTDPAEPNNGRGSATRVGKLGDRGGQTLELTQHIIDSRDDEDWFVVDIDDEFDGENPRIQVTLEDLPPGQDYDLGAWYDCNGGDEDTSCDEGRHSSLIGQGCVSQTGGRLSERVRLWVNCQRFLSSNDSGTLYIRVDGVAGPPNCTPYKLKIRIQ